MSRPKAILEANHELEQYEMYSVAPLCDDGDGARQHIATIYDHEEAAEVLRLWNSEDNDERIMKKEQEKQEISSKTETLIAALRQIVKDIHDSEGVVSAAILEAADRLEELNNERT